MMSGHQGTNLRLYNSHQLLTGEISYPQGLSSILKGMFSFQRSWYPLLTVMGVMCEHAEDAIPLRVSQA